MPDKTNERPPHKLDKTIERARECQQQGKPFPASVTFDPGIAIAGLLVAKKEHRDFSNLVEVAVADYCGGKAGEPTPELNELMAKLSAAAERNPAVLAEVERVLTQGRRRTRSAA